LGCSRIPVPLRIKLCCEMAWKGRVSHLFWLTICEIRGILYFEILILVPQNTAKINSTNPTYSLVQNTKISFAKLGESPQPQKFPLQNISSLN